MQMQETASPKNFFQMLRRWIFWTLGASASALRVAPRVSHSRVAFTRDTCDSRYLSFFVHILQHTSTQSDRVSPVHFAGASSSNESHSTQCSRGLVVRRSVAHEAAPEADRFVAEAAVRYDPVAAEQLLWPPTASFGAAVSRARARARALTRLTPAHAASDELARVGSSPMSDVASRPTLPPVRVCLLGGSRRGGSRVTFRFSCRSRASRWRWRATSSAHRRPDFFLTFLKTKEKLCVFWWTRVCVCV